MGYTTPLPEGVDPQEAYQEFLGSYEKEAKVSIYSRLNFHVHYFFNGLPDRVLLSTSHDSRIWVHQTQPRLLLPPSFLRDKMVHL